MPDETVEYGRIRQEPRIDRTGAEENWIVVPFWIGKHGPFTERFTLAEYQDGVTVRTRVEAVKATLRALPS